jgi:hypothetical protein
LMIGLAIQLLRWALRRRTAGRLLLAIDRADRSQLFLVGGLLWLGAANLLSLGYLLRISGGFPTHDNLPLEFGKIFCTWVWGVGLTMQGSRLELREQGICGLLSFLAWPKVKSYQYNQSQPQTLTLRLNPEYLRLPNFRSIAIPAQQHEAINQILAERLPDRHLAE